MADDPLFIPRAATCLPGVGVRRPTSGRGRRLSVFALLCGGGLPRYPWAFARVSISERRSSLTFSGARSRLPTRWMTFEATSLDAAMARLADGEREVFPLVFRALWDPMLRVCLRVLGNDADASDAAQEAMRKVFERASDYDGTRPALPWALAIAMWECRTILRKRSRRREVDDTKSVLLGASLEDELVQRNLVEVAASAMGTLSEADRETLLATFWDEEATVSGATLRKRRQRALERWKAALRRIYGVE